MVGMGALQCWDMRMGHRVIPPQLLIVEINFVGILENTLLQEIDLLKDTQCMVSVKLNFASHRANGLTNRVDRKRMGRNGWPISQ